MGEEQDRSHSEQPRASQTPLVSEVVKQAINLNKVMKQRLANLMEDGETANKNLKESALSSIQGKKIDPVQLQYFKEKKKSVYLNTLLKQLTDCFDKLKR